MENTRTALSALAICAGASWSSAHAAPPVPPPARPVVPTSTELSWTELASTELSSTELALSFFSNDSDDAAVPDSNDDERWRFEVTPVLWAAEMSGSGVIRGRSFEASASFGDVLRNLDFGGMLVAEANKGRFGIKFAGMFVKLSQDVRSGPLNPKLESKLGIAQLFASYELASIPLGSESDSSNRSTLGIEVYGGGRYTYFDGRLSLQGPLGFEAKDSASWIDPVIGGGLTFDLGEKWRVSVEGDIGGFGVSSDFVWSVSARVDYHVTPHISIMGGYHLLDYDFDGGLELKAQFRGPFLGVAIRF